MESGEDLLVEVYDGSSWQVAASFVSGVDFTNDTFTEGEVIVDGSAIALAVNGLIRFRCDASGNNDRIYLDEVVIEGR